MFDYLFISNGHGEDVIGSVLINQLKKYNPALRIAAYPLVGMGESYSACDAEILEPRQRLPSDGFVKGSLLRLWLDCRAGLLRLFKEQKVALRSVADEVKKVVAVGDFLPVALSSLYVKKPLYLLATAKSDYIAPHWNIELALFKRWTQVVFARDELTAASLKKSGVKATYLGNVMMDCFKIGVRDIKIEESRKTIAFLPGSRSDAVDNLVDMLRITKWLGSDYNYLVALAEKIAPPALKAAAGQAEWEWLKAAGDYRLKKEKVIVQIIRNGFGDVLNAANVVVGITGTANEQAVGLGKPVVAYARNRQTRKFLESQRKLLGKSLFLKPHDPEQIAAFIRDIIDDESRLKRISELGKKRMGKPGSAMRIARYLESER